MGNVLCFLLFKNSLPILRSWRCPLMFPSGSFIILPFTFRCTKNMEFILCMVLSSGQVYFLTLKVSICLYIHELFPGLYIILLFCLSLYPFHTALLSLYSKSWYLVDEFSHFVLSKIVLVSLVPWHFGINLHTNTHTVYGRFYIYIWIAIFSSSFQALQFLFLEILYWLGWKTTMLNIFRMIDILEDNGHPCPGSNSRVESFQ